MPFMKGEHWLLICDRGCCASVKEGTPVTEREENAGLLLGCRSVTVTYHALLEQLLQNLVESYLKGNSATVLTSSRKRA